MRRARAGVTLIEILIAVSLLSLLTVGVLTAMQLGLRTMDKVDSRMVRNRRVSSARAIIENELNGFTSTMAMMPQLNNRNAVFFQAEPESMRFVSSFSLEDAWRGRPQIAALQVIPGEHGEGVRLIVNEAPYTGMLQAGQFVTGFEPDGAGHLVTQFAPIVAGPQSFVLADRLKYCHFSYQERLLTAPFENWRQNWVRSDAYPSGVRIEMAPLAESPTDLHPTTVTVQLKVNVAPGVRYAQ